MQAENPTTDEIKAALRADARVVRSRIAGDAARHAVLAADLFDRALAPQRDQVLAGYWPLRDECDCRPILSRHQSAGGTCALPVVVEDGAPLQFFPWAEGDPLTPGRFGLLEPAQRATPLLPALIVVPLLAFDRAGNRLGYGGGYYDRTLADWRRPKPVTVGLAFAVQERPAVPRTDHDLRLDWIVTEREAIRATPGRRNGR